MSDDKKDETERKLMGKIWVDAIGPNVSVEHIDNATHRFAGERLEPLDEREINEAYRIWLGLFPRQEVDWQWRTYKANRGCDWLRQARRALNLSAATVGNFMNITRQAVHAIETAEDTGSLTLKNLEKAAAALNCEVRYSLRPVNGKHLSTAVWNAILPHALNDESLRRSHPSRRVIALAHTVRRLGRDSKFRKNMGWSRNS